MPQKKPLRSFHCAKCGRSIRMPKGWTVGPAVRRHYWAKHADVMRTKGRRR